MKKPFLLSFISGVFLLLVFPRFNQGWLAWVSLVPFILAVRQSTSRKQALGCGAIVGSVFFLTSLIWLNHVSWFGWLFVAFLETFFILFFSWFLFDGNKFNSPVSRVLWIAFAWTIAEWFRSEIPVFGLGWNLLAYSQSDYPTVLQSANAVGAYGLSFAIALVNGCLAEILLKAKSRKNFFSISNLLMFMFLFVVALAVSAHGHYHLRQSLSSSHTQRIAIIQGNIPQTIKWHPEARDKIIEIYLKLTELSFYESPDLTIWPEAAFPGYLNLDAEAEKIYGLAGSMKKPILVGAPHYEEPNVVYNSAYYINPEGDIEQRYDKLYLVPFGEYVPLKMIFGFLEPYAYSMGVSDFSAGKNHTVFRTQEGIPFSVLICFEDVFPTLARRFVNQGARFLTVITNDAWFGNSSAPYQHLQASIFRAVENGVSVVRAANTGVSAVISPRGIVTDRLRDEKNRDIFIKGKKVFTVSTGSVDTLYRNGGYLFPYGIFILFMGMFMALKLKKKSEATR